MTSINDMLSHKLYVLGADVVGFGDLTGLPPDVRACLPFGVCVAVKYPKDVIRGISDLPTREYFIWYNALNEKLDAIVMRGAEFLRSRGYQAIAQTRERVGKGEDIAEDRTALPHKTVATRAGIGWIGKCALLVTEEYGSMIRLSSVLTDAPLDCAEPADVSKCGGCGECAAACPAKAVSGRLWRAGTPREDFYDAAACRRTAAERSKAGFGGGATICGKCIEVCPYTRRYLEMED